MAIARHIVDAITLFRDLQPGSLERLAGLGTMRPVPSGTRLFELGGTADAFYVVTSGSVVLTMPIEIMGRREDAFFEEVRPGDMFGWSALVSPHRYTMTARAQVDSEVASWSGEAVRALVMSDTETGVRLLGNLSSIVCQRLHRVQAMWLRELQRTVSARLT